MKNIVLFYLLFVISTVSHGQTVSSRASAAADVDGLSIEHRPMKLFQCWGGPDESTSFRVPYHGSSDNSSGNITFHDSNFKSDYQAMNLRWNSDYADQTFNIDIIYDVAAIQRNDIPDVCSENENYRKVSSVSANVVSSVGVTVPPSVWFVRIERQDINVDLGQVESKLNGSDSLRSIQADSPSKDDLAKYGNNFYYSTKPGDKITLTVKWSQNALSSRRVTSKYKISFVGKDHCEALTRDFAATKYSAISKTLSSEKSDDLLLTMGCFLNEEIGMRVLKANDPTEVSQVLNKLEKIGLSNDNETLKNGWKAIRLVSQFAFYKIAYMALSDITTFCSSAKIDDPLTTSDGITVNGFMVNHYFLSRILYRLKAFDLTRFSVFIDLVNEMAKSKGTYQNLRGSKTDWDRVYKAYNILAASMETKWGQSLSTLPFNSTLYYFDHLQLQAIDHNAFDETREKLVRLSNMEQQFQHEFGTITWNLTTGPRYNIDTTAFSNLLTVVYQENNKVIDFIASKRNWFNTPDPKLDSSPFIADMTQYMIMVRHFAESVYDLDLVKHRPDFLAAYNPAVPLKGVNACLYSKK